MEDHPSLRRAAPPPGAVSNAWPSSAKPRVPERIPHITRPKLVRWSNPVALRRTPRRTGPAARRRSPRRRRAAATDATGPVPARCTGRRGKGGGTAPRPVPPVVLALRRFPDPRLTGLGSGLFCTATMFALACLDALLFDGSVTVYGVLFLLVSALTALWVRRADLVSAPVAVPIALRRRGPADRRRLGRVRRAGDGAGHRPRDARRLALRRHARRRSRRDRARHPPHDPAGGTPTSPGAGPRRLPAHCGHRCRRPRARRRTA